MSEPQSKSQAKRFAVQKGRRKVDYEEAWSLYYELANRRNRMGLTFEELSWVIDAALRGKDE